MSNSDAPPRRGPGHAALDVFVGEWRADGQSFGSQDQTAADPRNQPERWVSTHSARWHLGRFFLIQDERATIGPNPFATLSVMGLDSTTSQYFARTFENHGFCRYYDVDVNGRIWTFTGQTEPARIEFSEDGRTQTIAWQWVREGLWLPLCDRVAHRSD